MWGFHREAKPTCTFTPAFFTASRMALSSTGASMVVSAALVAGPSVGGTPVWHAMWASNSANEGCGATDAGAKVASLASLSPGSATGHHTHGMDYVIVPVTSGEMTIVAPNGERTKAQLGAGKSYFRKAGVQHDVLNETAAEIVFLEIELKP